MTFKRRRYECEQCHEAFVDLAWDGHRPESCRCGGTRIETPLHDVLEPHTGVIDDQLEGGPRWFETMGQEPVYIETKSQWRREVEQRNLINVVRHDAGYYARQRKRHDEERRDTGTNTEY